MSLHPAGHIDRIKTSPIREIARYGARFDDVISLWFGESDEPTPDFIKRAAAEALQCNETFYGPNNGIGELRESLSVYMAGLHGRQVGADRVSVTASGMQALMLASQALIEPGDNVVLVSPAWTNLTSMVAANHGETRYVSLKAGQSGWELDLDELLDSLDLKTRAVLVNSPNNPTGWVMPREQQKALLDHCRHSGTWIISDDVYQRIVAGGGCAPSFLDIGEPDDRIICANSFSKTWSMTGWRLGWLTAPAALMPTFTKLTEFNVSCATTFAQYGAIAALRQGEEFIRIQNQVLSHRRDQVWQRLSAIAGFDGCYSDATFYHFFRVAGVDDSQAAILDMISTAGVGVAPGSAFSGDFGNYFRLCYAKSDNAVAEALDRLEKFFQSRSGSRRDVA